jgi:hypothetical protein
VVRRSTVVEAIRSIICHCERSEAIHGAKKKLDCFVASLIALTGKGRRNVWSYPPSPVPP